MGKKKPKHVKKNNKNHREHVHLQNHVLKVFNLHPTYSPSKIRRELKTSFGYESLGVARVVKIMVERGLIYQKKRLVAKTVPYPTKAKTAHTNADSKRQKKVVMNCYHGLH